MKNHKVLTFILGVLLVAIISLGFTYAYWSYTVKEKDDNMVKSACLDIEFTGKNDINISNLYPMRPDELKQFLSTATPYHFTITNKCDNVLKTSINLETLSTVNKKLSDEWVNVVLFKDSYEENLAKNVNLSENLENNDEFKVIEDSLKSFNIYDFILSPKESEEFNLLLYLNPETPMIDANMEASWESKVTINAGYQNDTGNLKLIKEKTDDGMWNYKNKITKIVFEDNINEKEAPAGGEVYGPFDESVFKTNVIQSYVVCESESNCTAYIEGNGKVLANSDSSNLFNNFSNLRAIEGLENFDTTGVTNMANMFRNTGNFTADFSEINTDQVTLMNTMFSGSKITNVDLSSWNTSSVTDMSGMFSDSGLTDLDLSMWDVSNVTAMRSIFGGMLDIVNLNISTWNMSGLVSSTGPQLFGGNSSLDTINMTNVIFPENSWGLFAAGLYGLHNLILDGSNTSQVTNMGNMFGGNSSLQNLDLSMWDVSSVTNMSNIFSGTTGLKELNLSNWDLSNYPDRTNMFGGNTALTTVNMTNFVFPANSGGFFTGGLSNLQNVILTNSDTSHVTNMNSMFYGCSAMQSYDFSSWDTSLVTDISGMFSGNANIAKIDLSMWDTTNLTSVGGAFRGMSKLQRIDLSTWKFNDTITANFSSMTSLTYDNAIEEIILKNVDTSHVTTMYNMFSNFTNTTRLKTIDLSSFDTSQVTNMNSMFYGSFCFEELDLSNFNTKKLSTLSGMFSGTLGLNNLNLSNWDLSNLTLSPNMFGGNSKLYSINLTNFVFPSNCAGFFAAGLTGLQQLTLTGSNTSNTYNMSGMFSGCSSIETLDLSNFNISNVSSLSSIFAGCTSLRELNISNWNYKNIPSTSTPAMFGGNSKLQTITMYNSTLPVNSSYFFAGGLTFLETINFGVTYTNNVTNMASMFEGLSSLKIDELNIFNTVNVTNRSKTFKGCSSISTLDLQSWNTENVNDMAGIFAGCTQLKSLNIESWDLRGLDSSKEAQLFENNYNLTTLSVRLANFPINSSNLFAGLTNLGNMDLNNSFADAVTNMSNMFKDCSSMTKIDISNLNTSNVTDTSGMFSGMTNLQEFYSWNFNLENVTNVEDMFAKTYKLKSLLLRNATFNDTIIQNFSSVTGLSTTYEYEENSEYKIPLQTLSLEKFGGTDLMNVTNILNGLNNLTSINFSFNDLSAFDYDSFPTIFNDNALLETLVMNDCVYPADSNHFLATLSNYLPNLKELNVKNADLSKVTNVNEMLGFLSVTKLDISNWDLSNVSSNSALNLFKLSDKLETINMTNFVFPPNCKQLFLALRNLTDLNLTGSDTTHVTNMSEMFVDCIGLTSLNLSSWDTSNVDNMGAMFGNDVNLRSITYGSKFVHKANANVIAMFGGLLPEIPDDADYQYAMYQDCPANKPGNPSWNGVEYI